MMFIHVWVVTSVRAGLFVEAWAWSLRLCPSCMLHTFHRRTIRNMCVRMEPQRGPDTHTFLEPPGHKHHVAFDVWCQHSLTESGQNGANLRNTVGRWRSYQQQTHSHSAPNINASLILLGENWAPRWDSHQLKGREERLYLTLLMGSRYSLCQNTKWL